MTTVSAKKPTSVPWRGQLGTKCPPAVGIPAGAQPRHPPGPAARNRPTGRRRFHRKSPLLQQAVVETANRILRLITCSSAIPWPMCPKNSGTANTAGEPHRRPPQGNAPPANKRRDAPRTHYVPTPRVADGLAKGSARRTSLGRAWPKGARPYHTHAQRGTAPPAARGVQAWRGTPPTTRGAGAPAEPAQTRSPRQGAPAIPRNLSAWEAGHPCLGRPG